MRCGSCSLHVSVLVVPQTKTPMFIRNRVAKAIAVTAVVLLCRLPSSAASNPAADTAIPARLDAIEALLKQVADVLKPPTPAPQKTRLLIPFASNVAGFDTGISITNTGRDSTGVVGKAGRITLHFFGTPNVASQTTNADVAPGGSLTFVLSSGGSLGITGAPNFQGYIEVVCDFPFAHGYGFFTDGPIGVAKVGASLPVLVLPLVRTSALEESLGR
jgi:hypothetical protein